MQEQQEIEALRERLDELEARNRELEAAIPGAVSGAVPGPRGRGRAALAVILIAVSVLLAPVAVLGAWARLQLVDTDRFVQTFAPLAKDPAVQAFVTDQVVQGIEQNVDIDGLVGDLFSGIGDLGLPPRSAAALGLLEGPAAEGLRSLMGAGVERVVASPQFAQLWEGALRETHSRAIAVIQGDPGSALQLSDDGALSLSLNTVIVEVKRVLVQQGLGFAERIPEIDRTIPILASDALGLVRTVYQIAVTAGYWLPWAVLAMLAVGVAAARDRSRALVWTGAGLAASLLLLAAGLGIGRRFFVGAVSPSIMPAATAEVLFAQVTQLVSSTILVLVVLSLVIALGAWLAGASRAARAARSAADAGFSAVRGAADRHGFGTGGFGRLVERWHSAILALTIGLGILALFLGRPITLGGVVATLVIVLVVLVALQLLRRPATAEVPDSAEDPEPGGPAGSRPPRRSPLERLG